MTPPSIDSVVLLALVVGFCLGAFLGGRPVCERRKLNRTAKMAARHETSISGVCTELMGMRSICRTLERRVAALEDRSNLMEDET